MTEHDDLNRKLVKWAGRWEDGKWLYLEGLKFPIDIWNKPTAKGLEPIPDFPHSTDACFKHLVPNIKNLIGIEFYPIIVEGLDTGDGYWWTIYTGTSPYRWQWEKFEGPSLSEAIEKLIIDEEQNENT